jgi:hypothetical protein
VALEATSRGSRDEPSAPDWLKLFTTTDGLNLAKAFTQVKDRKLRLPILHLVEELVGLGK